MDARQSGLPAQAAAVDAYYLELRTIHIGAVTLSGLLFLLRALAFNLTDASWPLKRPARIIAYAVDTTLLSRRFCSWRSSANIPSSTPG